MPWYALICTELQVGGVHQTCERNYWNTYINRRLELRSSAKLFAIRGELPSTLTLLKVFRLYAGNPFSACPRSALVTLVEGLQRDLGLTFGVGFETEFYLLRPQQASAESQSLHPVDRSLYSQTYALDAMAAGDISCGGLCGMLNSGFRAAKVPCVHHHCYFRSGMSCSNMMGICSLLLARQPCTLLSCCNELAMHAYCLQNLQGTRCELHMHSSEHRLGFELQCWMRWLNPFSPSGLR